MSALRDWGICQHTEHAIGEGGRVGRWFPDGALYGDPAGKWEPCPGGESAGVRIAEAERRGAVKALRFFGDKYLNAEAWHRADAIEKGAEL